MVKTKEDILSSIKDMFKDDTSDSTLGFIEDVTDTINDLEGKASGQDDWKAKYEENDKEWREKYKERFFSGGDAGGKPTEKEKETESKDEEREYGYREDGTPMTFEDLFKKE